MFNEIELRHIENDWEIKEENLMDPDDQHSLQILQTNIKLVSPFKMNNYDSIFGPKYDESE